MPVVSVPPPYRGPTGGQSEVSVDGETVRACLGAVDARYPGFADLIFDTAGNVHGFVRVFVNDEPVEADALDAVVRATDTVSVVAAIAGGRGERPAAAGGCGTIFASPAGRAGEEQT